MGRNEKGVNLQSDLGTETVKGSARPFQGIDDIESGDGLALSMLGVGNRVTDDLVRQRGQEEHATREVINDDIHSPRRS